MDVSKLKVAELRAELTSRGLDSKGLKTVLVERLKQAIEDEAQAEEPDRQEESTQDDGTEEDAPEEEESTADTEKDEIQTEEESAPPQEDLSEPVADELVKKPVEEEEPVATEPASKEPVEEPPQEEPESETRAEKPESETRAEEPESETKAEEPESVMRAEETESETRMEEPAASEQTETPTEEEEPQKDQEEPMDAEDAAETTLTETTDMQTEEPSVETKDPEVKEENGDSFGRKPSEKRALSPSGNDEKRMKFDDDSKQDNEPDFDKTVVALDWYNSDLSLKIDLGRLEAVPFVRDGFGYMWHGVRATHGIKSGKFFFETTIVEELDLSHMEEAEPCPHAVRVGWSTDDASLSLGEDKNSWGFGGTGKASTELKFKDYGKTFGKGDVVGSFLDFDAEKITITFTINGESQGTCFEIEKENFEDTPLFPHILTKNTSFKVNFGADEPAFEPLPDYEFIGKAPLEDRVAGIEGPSKKEDAEVIMMVGLPAAGKTTWVDKHVLEHPEKRYNVLGTNCLIDKMKVMGLPRKRNYAGRWETLIEKCTKCLNKLLSMASKRRRNFIIDQTNVYPNAQRRKMKGFDGFQRRAVVVCPSDEELKERAQKREKLEGKDVPDRAVLEMKANFKLPTVGESFHEVEFVELPKEEAETLVTKYNKEGEDAGLGPKHRPRSNYGQGKPISNRTTYDRSRRDHYHDKGGYRGGWERDRDRRGSYDRRDRGGRDHRDYRRDNRSGGPRDHRGGGGGYHRDRFNRGGGGGNYNNYGGGWNDYKGQQRRPQSNQYNNQQGWNQNNQWGNNQGNWNNQGGYGQQQQQQYGNYNQNYYSQQNQQQQQQQPQQGAAQSGTTPTQYWTNAYGQQGYNNTPSTYNTQGGYQGYNYNQQSATPTATQGTTPAQPQAAPQTQQWNTYSQGYNYDQYNRK